MNKRYALGFLFAFVAGCLAAPLVMNPPTARSQDVQRWEVYCESARVGSPAAAAQFVMQAGNRAGAEGWG